MTIADSAPGEANEAGFVVTGLTNEVAHTFELRAANAGGGSGPVVAGPVTPTPGICDRTPQVRDGILVQISGVDDCAAVTVANLRGITRLDLNGRALPYSSKIASLQAGDFSGLPSLVFLNLSANFLEELPDGVFSDLSALTNISLERNKLSGLPADVFSGLPNLVAIILDENEFTELPAGVLSGLSNLATLRLEKNVEDPLPFTVTLEKDPDGNRVRAKVLAGVPFAVALPVTLANGALAGGATTITVAAAATESAYVAVTRTAGTTAAVTADIDLTTQPTLPYGHTGYAFARSTSGLPAEILPVAVGVAPSFTSSPTFGPDENQTTVGTVEASDDDTGDDITGYTLSGGADQALFAIDGMSGALVFQAPPNYEDPQDADTNNDYLVEVQATGGTGGREQSATQTITVTVTDAEEQPDKPAGATAARAPWRPSPA